MRAPLTYVADVNPEQTVAQVNELPEDRNFAEDEEVMAYIVNHVLPIIDYTVQNRGSLSEKWAANRRMDLQIFDDNRKYVGRSNTYMPAWSRANKTLIANMSAGLFPSDEYLDVIARTPGVMDEESKLMKSYLLHQFGTVAKVPNKIKPFLREFGNTGNAVLKFSWNQERKNMRKRSLLNPNMMMSDGRQSPAYHEGLSVSVRSIHNVFFFPMTAESLQDIQLITEVVQVSNGYVREMTRKKAWANGEQAIGNRTEMNKLLQSARLIEEKDNASDEPANVASTGDLGQTYLLETYTYMKLPKSAYNADEDTEAPVPVQIISCGGTLLNVRRNPFFHQAPPYLVARDNVHAGSFYGRGLAEMVAGLQHLANDFANQGNDAAIYALNPIVKVNTSYLKGLPPKMRPGAVWRMTDIDKGMAFDRPPMELIQGGQSMLQFYLGAVSDYGGAPPVLQGQSGGRSAKTATGAQILQRNALQPLQDVIEDIETDVLTPLMYHTQCLARQFQDRMEGLMVMGKPQELDPAIFEKEFEFRVLASSQMVNQQMRAQSVQQYLMAVTPLIPYLMQIGYKFDPAPLLRNMYYDGFGFRGFEDILQRVAPPNIMGPPPEGEEERGAPGQQTPPLPPNVSGFPGGEQMANPVPGEGDELGSVQAPAQQLAALFGATGGAL